ncbi:hypothetical protein [Microbacterium sp. SORGH_AS_0888]|uniref:hypothetical protein n=1 Tax=Microbacterium sp. SORGH_AS_0888 TaxID=3041791 RepID=UPI002788017A|nr:hypothetical protein [Microbacterium sp. SORGH_AS_0888]MDQ1129902.1 hypothetical protein [Microbacterium sp. SORGH_AS_0888]
MPLHSSSSPRRLRRSALSGIAAALAVLLLSAPLSATADDGPGAASDASAAEAPSTATGTVQPTTGDPTPGTPVARAPESAPETQASPEATTVTRTISGTIHFDPVTTAAQRQSVTIEATPELSGPSAGSVSYDAATGAYSVDGLAPGTYRVFIQIHTDGWVFSASTQPTSAWDASDGDWEVTVDLEAGDRPGLDVFFDRARAGLGLTADDPAAYCGSVDSDEQVVAIDLATGAEWPFRCFGGGQGASWWNLTATPGTTVTVRIVSGGITFYYDGTGSAATDPAKAVPVTLGGPWTGAQLTVDLGDVLAPAFWEFTDASRGAVTVPSMAAEGATVSVHVGAEHAGETVRAWMYSSPTFLGRTQVGGDGYVTFALAPGLTGDHRIAIGAMDGSLIGWGPINVLAAAEADATDVPAAQTLAATGVALPPLALCAIIAALVAGVAMVAVSRRARTR